MASKNSSQKRRVKVGAGDIVDMFDAFRHEVLENKPSIEEMFDEIRMMKFKIRPLHGNISSLDFKNSGFIETLWSLGKLDDFFHTTVEAIPEESKDVFFNLFNNMYNNYHKNLNSINIKPESPTRDMPGFEMEIYKEIKSNKVVN